MWLKTLFDYRAVVRLSNPERLCSDLYLYQCNCWPPRQNHFISSIDTSITCMYLAVRQSNPYILQQTWEWTFLKVHNLLYKKTASLTMQPPLASASSGGCWWKKESRPFFCSLDCLLISLSVLLSEPPKSGKGKAPSAPF